jgi:hypothetical protein
MPRAAFMRAMTRARMLGKQVFCSLSREKRQRTIPQNRRWRGLIVPLFSEWSGYEADEAHEVLLERFAPKKSTTWPDGTVHETAKRTSDLTVEEMVELQDRVERWLTVDCGVRIPADERGRA